MYLYIKKFRINFFWMLGSLIRAYKKIAGKISFTDQHANFFWNSASSALLQKKLLGRSALNKFILFLTLFIFI